MSEQQTNSTSTTKVPIPVVDPGNLPREKGWTYDEMCRVVGNLYLESRHRTAVMEEQFHAIVAEYQRTHSAIEQELANSRAENMKLRKELERRDELRNSPSSGVSREGSL